jgi:hypothetical protein
VNAQKMVRLKSETVHLLTSSGLTGEMTKMSDIAFMSI